MKDVDARPSGKGIDESRESVVTTKMSARRDFGDRIRLGSLGLSETGGYETESEIPAVGEDNPVVRRTLLERGIKRIMTDNSVQRDIRQFNSRVLSRS